jgi:CheY-like chemotaxis protein/nucleoside 2-deoxyribosyltransferase
MNVFLSYNSKNEDFAELVKMKLEKENIQVWKDTSQIDAGREWRNEIDQGLLNCDIVIVLLNQLSAKSPYVTYEWAFALGKGKAIIPVLSEDCEIHPRIEVLQRLDFKDSKRPWDKLIEMVKKVNKTNNTIKVSDLTVDELEKLISGSKNLASESAKNEGRVMQEIDITEVANRIVNAKSHFEAQQIKNNTILWVDDRPNNNLYERQTLEFIGFKFDLALSTQEALQKLKSNNYIAIISDMGRVEGPKEGYVLLKEVRKSNKTIPYFIYAGSNLLEHKIEAQEKGAQGLTNIATELIDLITSHVQPTNE